MPADREGAGEASLTVSSTDSKFTVDAKHSALSYCNAHLVLLLNQLALVCERAARLGADVRLDGDRLDTKLAGIESRLRRLALIVNRTCAHRLAAIEPLGTEGELFDDAAARMAADRADSPALQDQCSLGGRPVLIGKLYALAAPDGSGRLLHQLLTDKGFPLAHSGAGRDMATQTADGLECERGRNGAGCLGYSHPSQYELPVESTVLTVDTSGAPLQRLRERRRKKQTAAVGWAGRKQATSRASSDSGFGTMPELTARTAVCHDREPATVTWDDDDPWQLDEPLSPQPLYENFVTVKPRKGFLRSIMNSVRSSIRRRKLQQADTDECADAGEYRTYSKVVVGDQHDALPHTLGRLERSCEADGWAGRPATFDHRRRPRARQQRCAEQQRRRLSVPALRAHRADENQPADVRCALPLAKESQIFQVASSLRRSETQRGTIGGKPASGRMSTSATAIAPAGFYGSRTNCWKVPPEPPVRRTAVETTPVDGEEVSLAPSENFTPPPSLQPPTQAVEALDRFLLAKFMSEKASQQPAVVHLDDGHQRF